MVTGCAGVPRSELVYFMGTPWATASVNGEEGMFLIDTGASMSVIDSQVARAAAAIAVGELDVVGTTGEVRVASGVAEELRFAGRTHRDRLVSIQDLASFRGPSGRPQFGLIGNDFFLEYNLVFDFEKNRVGLTTREAPVGGGLDPYQMLLSNGIPTVQVWFNGQRDPLWARIDTGNGYAEETHLYIDVSLPVAERLLGDRLKLPPTRTVTVVSVASTETLPVYDFTGVQILGQEIQNVRIVVHEHGRGTFSDPDGVLITGGLLRYFSRMELDFPRRTIWTKP